jgi:hypothetical protein
LLQFNHQIKQIKNKEEIVMAEMMPGGWTAFSFTITQEAKKVFDQALKGLVGVSYTPLAFATQVVAGTNYCFLCQGKVVYPGAPELAAKVYIYVPLQGEPHLSQIIQITP